MNPSELPSNITVENNIYTFHSSAKIYLHFRHYYISGRTLVFDKIYKNNEIIASQETAISSDFLYRDYIEFLPNDTFRIEVSNQNSGNTTRWQSTVFLM